MQTVVGVLRGGPSREHEMSLKTGHAMLSNLAPERYEPRDIFIDKAGTWHLAGRPVTPERALQQVDVALVGLHGYSVRSEAQRALERYGVPYAGTDILGSHLAAHRALARAHAHNVGLVTPRDVLIEASDDLTARAVEIIRQFTPPMVVRPALSGVVEDVLVSGYAELLGALTALIDAGVDTVQVEEYVRGRRVSAGVVEGLRGERYYVLPVTEVIAPSVGVPFERMACPAQLSQSVGSYLASAASTIHETLGLRHYSQSDFAVSPRAVHYLGTHTSPEFGPDSHMIQSLAAVGVTPSQFLEHLVKMAMSR